MKRGEREYSSTFNRLTVDGFVPEQNLQFRSKVAVCEKGKRYALATAEGQDSVVNNTERVHQTIASPPARSSFHGGHNHNSDGTLSSLFPF